MDLQVVKKRSMTIRVWTIYIYIKKERSFRTGCTDKIPVDVSTRRTGSVARTGAPRFMASVSLHFNAAYSRIGSRSPAIIYDIILTIISVGLGEFVFISRVCAIFRPSTDRIEGACNYGIGNVRRRDSSVFIMATSFSLIAILWYDKVMSYVRRRIGARSTLVTRIATLLAWIMQR